MKEISSLNLAQVVALIRATPQTLRRLLSPLDGAILSWRPAPNDRSINDIIGYLIESDQHAYAAPIHSMLAYDLPELEAWDDRLSLQDQHDERDVLELLAELEVMRHEQATLIANLRPSQLARSGFHPQVGELQVVDFIYDWVFHDCGQMKQIMDLIQMSAWPKMGNLRHIVPPK